MNFPRELIKIAQWVCYRLMPGKDGEKPRKVPINPLTGKNAQTNNSKTWSSYETAMEACKTYNYSGVGFVFTQNDNYVGIDIDHCYDPESNEFNDTAKAILAKSPTYAEISPSGSGIHLLYKGKKPVGKCKNTDTGVEMYENGRYLTMTGNKLEGSPDTITEDNGALSWIHENYIKSHKAKEKDATTSLALTDEELIKKASEAKNSGETFASLLKGSWQDKYKSQSEADYDLCCKLAFWSAKNISQMDRIFRSSALYRKKWDEVHYEDGTTYGRRTLERAIAATKETFCPSNKKKGSGPVFEFHNRYYRSKGENSFYPITNFIVVPNEMIVSDDDTQLNAELVTDHDEKFHMSFLTTVFSNQQKFKNLLNRNTISLSYFGSDGDLELLKGYISELDWEKRTGVKAIGLYEHDGELIFVSNDKSVNSNGEEVTDCIQLDKYKSIESNILCFDTLTKEELLKIGSFLMSYNEPAKTISILSWASSCFAKELLNELKIKFPHLFLIGEAGSGKSTTLERVLLTVFSCSRVIACTQVTGFTLMKESASSNTIPFFLDEFKPSKIDHIRLAALYNYFRDSYDGHDGMRGRADLSVILYHLSAPLVVAGEESADETAIRERGIELLFSKKDLKNLDYRAAFNSILSHQHLLSKLGRTILSAALKLSTTEVSTWYDEGKSRFTSELPSRIVSNLACCWTGLRLLEKVCHEYGLAFNEVFPFDLDVCLKYLEYGAKNYLLDGGTHNPSIVEQSFEIIARMHLDHTCFKIEDGKLYIWLSEVYDDYTKYRRDHAIVGEVLPYQQFMKQLKHSQYYLASNYQKMLGGFNRKCWVLDFNLLSENCDVSEFLLSAL